MRRQYFALSLFQLSTNEGNSNSHQLSHGDQNRIIVSRWGAIRGLANAAVQTKALAGRSLRSGSPGRRSHMRQAKLVLKPCLRLLPARCRQLARSKVASAFWSAQCRALSVHQAAFFTSFVTNDCVRRPMICTLAGLAWLSSAWLRLVLNATP
jgi:hypothetical protein